MLSLDYFWFVTISRTFCLLIMFAVNHFSTTLALFQIFVLPGQVFLMLFWLKNSPKSITILPSCLTSGFEFLRLKASPVFAPKQLRFHLFSDQNLSSLSRWAFGTAKQGSISFYFEWRKNKCFFSRLWANKLRRFMALFAFHTHYSSSESHWIFYEWWCNFSKQNWLITILIWQWTQISLSDVKINTFF